MVDEIVFDYNHAPLQSEYRNIGDYMDAAVRAIRERAERCGLSPPTFEFRMSSELWEGISAFYACFDGTDGYQVSMADVVLRWTGIKKNRVLVVGGTEYSVSLDEGTLGSVFFSVTEPGWFSLSAEIKNVGSSIGFEARR